MIQHVFSFYHIERYMVTQYEESVTELFLCDDGSALQTT